MNITTYFTIVLLLTLTACGQTISNGSGEKQDIIFDEVESVEIENSSFGQSDEKINHKILTNAQVKIFAAQWNSSKSTGPCKFRQTYGLFVTLKDGTKRTFRANGPSIKEEKDYCFEISDDQFFANLYNNANPTIAEKKKTIDLMQGVWYHSEDRLASLTIHNYQWTFNYKGEKTTPDDNYYITISDKLPEFVQETVQAEFIILTNKTDTLKYEILGLTDSTFSLLYFPRGNIHFYMRRK